MKRRMVLAGAGVTLSTAVSGCLGSNETDDANGAGGPDEPPVTVDELDGHVRPDGDPEHVPSELVCDDSDFKRHYPMVENEDDTYWGTDSEEHFALRVNDRTFERGETVEITLTNITAHEQRTGNRHIYGFQLKTDEGWQDVRGWEDGSEQPYTSEAISHDPGEGFEWELAFTEEGLIEPGHTHEDRLVVCPDLKEGRYRFTVGMNESIAVAFDFQG